MDAFDISASGMRAQRLRMETVSRNLANVDTTSFRRAEEIGPDGTTRTRHEPYRRQLAVFMQGEEGFGVVTPNIVEDASPLRIEHRPDHPHADAQGRVAFPNVHPVTEMVDMIAASRAYEANVSAIDAHKAMRAASLGILA